MVGTISLYPINNISTSNKNYTTQQKSNSTGLISSLQEKKTKSIQISKNSTKFCKEDLDDWLIELFDINLEIQNHKLLYTNYIQTLSLYIFYTNIIIALLYTIIIVISIIYLPCCDPYFYYMYVMNFYEINFLCW